MDIKQQMEAVNAILQAGEPGNITTDEHAGYTGYRPQAIVDAMNEGFGIGQWGFEEVSSEIIPGEKGGLAIAQVQVWLAGVDFKPTSWGQNRVTRGDVGDAKKAAQTDAIKKALSYFSIGNRAYHGLLDAKAPRPALQPVQVTNSFNAPTPFELSKLFKTINQSIETAQKLVFKAVKPLDNLTPEECMTLKATFDGWKKTYDERQKAS